MVRPNDKVFFALAALAGALVLLASTLSTWWVGLDAAVGAGEAQQSYNFNRDLRPIAYHELGSLIFPVGGVTLGLLGLTGLLRPSKSAVLAVAGVTTILFVQSLRTMGYFHDAGGIGVHSCEEPRLEGCIGFLAPAVRDLRADILRKPIAQDPEFLGPGKNSYRSGSRNGWTLMGWTIAVFSFVAWYRAALAVTGRVRVAFAVVGVIGLVVLLYLFAKLLEAVGEG
jgi:hypothetical protein